MKLDGEELLVMKESEILAVIDEQVDQQVKAEKAA